ncbi:MAG TPA: hypothetical protein VEL06_03030, partial [Haliangiales bacterium]|nr:hypothetical protein [Haliangiales bacterium]
MQMTLQRPLNRARHLLATAREAIRPVCRSRTRSCLILLTVAIASVTNPLSSQGADWQTLFDGKTLRGWKITDF